MPKWYVAVGVLPEACRQLGMQQYDHVDAMRQGPQVAAQLGDGMPTALL